MSLPRGMGSIEEYTRLAELLRAAVEGGINALKREDVRLLKGYGLFAEFVGEEVLIGARIRTVAGRLKPGQLRALAEIAERHGGWLELTARQGFQVHNIRVEEFLEFARRLLETGLTTKGGCGDTARAITTCPVSDVDPQQALSTFELVEEVNRRYYDEWELFGNLWRKFKVTITGCPFWCTDPESQCLSFVAVERKGELGFTVLVGGGLSAVPRKAVHMPVFIRPDPNSVFAFIRGLVRVWMRDSRYKVRHRARIKFLVEDYGVPRLLEEVRREAGIELEEYARVPARQGFSTHMGIHAQRQSGMVYVGVPVPTGVLKSAQAREIADAVEELTESGEIRLTPQQNLIITNVPEEALPRLLERLRKAGFRVFSAWSALITACVTHPYCLYGARSINAKRLAGELVEELDRRVGSPPTPIRVAVTGCTHDCARTQIADVGLKGIPGNGGEPQVEITLGTLTSRVRVARVPLSRAKEVVVKIVSLYTTRRRPGERVHEWYLRERDRVEL